MDSLKERFPAENLKRHTMGFSGKQQKYDCSQNPLFLCAFFFVSFDDKIEFLKIITVSNLMIDVKKKNN